MSTQLVTVATFDQPIAAEMARSKLEAVDVRVFLADEATVRMAPHLGSAMGGVKLQVRENDLELALSVLEAETDRPSEGASHEDVASEAADESTKERDEFDSIRSYQRISAVLVIVIGGVYLIVFFLLIVSDMLS